MRPRLEARVTWFAFLIEVMRANPISKRLFILGETTSVVAAPPDKLFCSLLWCKGIPAGG